MSDPKDLPLKWMHDIQFKKLSTTKNVAKDHWLDMTPHELFNRLQGEVDELHEAMFRKGSPKDIISECADVANFATMIAHKMKTIEGGRNNEQTQRRRDDGVFGQNNQDAKRQASDLLREAR